MNIEQFVAMNRDLPIPFFEIHSRMSQSARTKSVESFRAARAAALISSDVTARGMDFPGVDYVIQVGIASDPQQCASVCPTTFAATDMPQTYIVLVVRLELEALAQGYSSWQTSRRSS